MKRDRTEHAENCVLDSTGGIVNSVPNVNSIIGADFVESLDTELTIAGRLRIVKIRMDKEQIVEIRIISSGATQYQY